MPTIHDFTLIAPVGTKLHIFAAEDEGKGEVKGIPMCEVAKRAHEITGELLLDIIPKDDFLASVEEQDLRIEIGSGKGACEKYEGFEVCEECLKNYVERTGLKPQHV